MIRTITLLKPILLLISVIISAATYAQDNIIDQVVWVVGDEAILKSEVEEERLNALMEHRDLDGDPYCVIPERI